VLKLFQPVFFVPQNSDGIKIEDTIKVQKMNGEILEEYSILSVLGRGARSVVYQARSHATLAEVALKLEPISKNTQLMNEVSILKALAGIRGVPTLISYGFTLDKTQYYSVTDVIGVSIDKRQWSPQELQLLWKAAKEIIREVHSRGVVITDLKPAHLILSRHGLFIIDYGCAYFAGKGRKVSLILSSLAFSSVRDATHFGDPGFISDWESLIFSFLYLVNRLPWSNKRKHYKSVAEIVKEKKRVLRKFSQMPPTNVPLNV